MHLQVETCRHCVAAELQPNTAYTFRVREACRDPESTSYWSDPSLLLNRHHYMTLASHALPPTDIKIGMTYATNTLSVSWTPDPSSCEASAVQFKRWIIEQTASLPCMATPSNAGDDCPTWPTNTSWESVHGCDILDHGISTCNVSGLVNRTAYRFRIREECDEGRLSSVFSNDIETVYNYTDSVFRESIRMQICSIHV